MWGEKIPSFQWIEVWVGSGKLKALWQRESFLLLSDVSKLMSGRFTEIHRLNFLERNQKKVQEI